MLVFIQGIPSKKFIFMIEGEIIALSQGLLDIQLAIKKVEEASISSKDPQVGKDIPKELATILPFKK
jgi:hypothetical protein